MIETDILIAGGGIAGLSAAAAFCALGFAVTCVDPAPPVTDRDAEGSDLRTTAFLTPAQSFLSDAGVWDLLAPHAAALRTMRIVDAGGPEPVERVRRDFLSDDIGEPAFGYNLPNYLIRKALLDRLAELPNVTFRPGIALTRLMPRTQEAMALLSDKTQIRARMVIGADGRQSKTRDAIRVGTQTHDFGQRALTFAVSHDIPHEDVSTEIHRTGGPFTLVPLPDYRNRPTSAVVWMETEAKAQALLALDNATFEAAATERSAGVLGTLNLVTRRTSWPMMSLLAHRFYGPRTALVAEAAHVMPPIGAQGLNTSLKDLQALLDLCAASPDRIGEPDMLRAYHRARYSDVATRVFGVSALNTASIAAPQPFRDMRAAGLKVLHDVQPLRKSLMKLGMGSS